MATRSYPTAAEVQAERWPTYRDVFSEWHLKAARQGTARRNPATPTEAHRIAATYLGLTTE